MARRGTRSAPRRRVAATKWGRVAARTPQFRLSPDGRGPPGPRCPRAPCLDRRYGRVLARWIVAGRRSRVDPIASCTAWLPAPTVTPGESGAALGGGDLPERRTIVTRWGLRGLAVTARETRGLRWSLSRSLSIRHASPRRACHLDECCAPVRATLSPGGWSLDDASSSAYRPRPRTRAPRSSPSWLRRLEGTRSRRRRSFVPLGLGVWYLWGRLLGLLFGLRPES